MNDMQWTSVVWAQTFVKRMMFLCKLGRLVSVSYTVRVVLSTTIYTCVCSDFCNLDVQYLSSACQIELSWVANLLHECIHWMVGIFLMPLFKCGCQTLYNQCDEAINMPVKWNQTMWVILCQNCMDFSYSKYVQFAPHNNNWRNLKYHYWQYICVVN